MWLLSNIINEMYEFVVFKYLFLKAKQNGEK